jgi:hypothetical protein
VFNSLGKLAWAGGIAFCLAFSCQISNAAIVFTNHMHARFDFEVVNGPLAGLVPVGTVLNFAAKGNLTFTLADGPPNATALDFTNVTGTLTGIAPAEFLDFTMTPETQFGGGKLVNIVRDGLGSITSGKVENLRMLWEMNATPAILGGAPVRLYTKEFLPFNGIVGGTPFLVGNILAGAADFGVYLDTRSGDNDPLAVIGRNRILEVTAAVPEPNSVGVFTILGLGLVATRWRRRSQKIC